jgi:hypothetical protein
MASFGVPVDCRVHSGRTLGRARLLAMRDRSGKPRPTSEFGERLVSAGQFQ